MVIDDGSLLTVKRPGAGRMKGVGLLC